jgi:hypothetical protein
MGRTTGVRFPAGIDAMSRSTLGLNRPRIQWILGIQHTKFEAHSSYPSFAEANKWAFSPSPSCLITSCLISSGELNVTSPYVHVKAALKRLVVVEREVISSKLSFQRQTCCYGYSCQRFRVSRGRHGNDSTPPSPVALITHVNTDINIRSAKLIPCRKHPTDLTN